MIEWKESCLERVRGNRKRLDVECSNHMIERQEAGTKQSFYDQILH